MKHTLPFATALGITALLSSCTIDDGIGSDVANTVERKNKWAIDMTKVEAHYGESTSVFLGAAHGEAGLPPIPSTAGAIIWDQTAKREADGSLHREKGDEYSVITKDGNKLDPQGYVNLIPMLRDTDPAQQKHIKAVLQDGDVLVYFIPSTATARPTWSGAPPMSPCTTST